MRNYTLLKLRVKRTGIVIGHNQYGSRWIELWFRGNVETHYFINNDPNAIKRSKITDAETIELLYV